MKIYTGNFANVKKYIASGLHPISIALTARYFSGDKYRPFNPDWSFKDDPEEIYKKKFAEKLSILEKNQVIEELSCISNGKDVILLCHEKFGDFCHRHLVNEWIGGNGEFGKNSNIIKENQLSLL